MKNPDYFHFSLKPIDLEISNFNFSDQSIFSVVADHPLTNECCTLTHDTNNFSYIDPRGRPQSRPVVITISHRVSVRLSVPKLQNQATITSGWDCGLAEWIIDDSCLVYHRFVIGITYSFNDLLAKNELILYSGKLVVRQHSSCS